jgi:cyclophilin family peptidyl-prolyl cis-trans isomerase
MGPDEDPNTFQVELFPLSELPHTIFTFLDMVDLRLFDGTAFVAANGSRIEGGAPILTEQSSVKILERYSKYGYNHRSPLGFNEYSPQYPHVAFTIGFKGRHPAAGPALAINMMDNSEIRGPGDNRRGDPCFGKIISGFDTLQRIQKAPRAADRYRLALNVQIVSVRQLRSSPKKAADDAGSTTASV